MGGARSTQLALAGLTASWLVVGCSFDTGPVLPAVQGSNDDAEHPVAGGSMQPAAAVDAGARDGGGGQAGGNAPVPVDAGETEPPAVDSGSGQPSSPMDAEVADSGPTVVDASDAQDEEPLDAAPEDVASPDAASSTPDANDPPACDCLCAHDPLPRMREPGCTPQLCPIDQCAPDGDCVLKIRATTGYYVCDDERSFDQARERCAQSEGMHLVAIESKEEDDFLLSSVTADKVWIGGNDYATEGTFEWETGEVFWRGGANGAAPHGVYTNFVDYEPNNEGLSNGPADCVILWQQPDAWADASCNDPHGYVCEFELRTADVPGKP